MRSALVALQVLSPGKLAGWHLPYPVPEVLSAFTSTPAARDQLLGTPGAVREPLAQASRSPRPRFPLRSLRRRGRVPTHGQGRAGPGRLASPQRGRGRPRCSPRPPGAAGVAVLPAEGGPGGSGRLPAGAARRCRGCEGMRGGAARPELRRRSQRPPGTAAEASGTRTWRRPRARQRAGGEVSGAPQRRGAAGTPRTPGRARARGRASPLAPRGPARRRPGSFALGPCRPAGKGICPLGRSGGQAGSEHGLSTQLPAEVRQEGLATN